ncbi:hypothetical protein GE061_011952, partial [Apolygus lucorum]
DCPEGNFTCKGSKTCILQRSFCDGQIDCPQGEDEDPMYCHDFYGSFWPMVDNLEADQVTNDTCELDLVPDICQCTGFVVVCAYSSLSHVPSPISSNVKGITLDNNRISSLEVGAFNGYSLHLIHLASNELKDLPDGIFARQTKLRKLYLAHNKLTSLPNSLTTLPNLEWLFADKNNLTHLSLEIWDLPSLMWLVLSENALTLTNESFPVLPSLEMMNLDSNEISRIEATTFSNLNMLHDLSIARNKIDYISEVAFRNLTNLKDLNLKYNSLFTLGDRLLVNQVYLEKL